MASGMGIGLGYAAGAVNKTLEEMLKQRLAQQQLEELLRAGEFNRDIETKKYGLDVRKTEGEEQERPGIIDLRAVQAGQGRATTDKTQQDIADAITKARDEALARQRREAARGVLDPKAVAASDFGSQPSATNVLDPTGDITSTREQAEAIELEKLRQSGALAQSREVSGRPQRGAVKIQTGVLNEQGQRVNRIIDAEGNVVSESPAAPTQGQQTRLAALSSIKDALTEMKTLYKKQYVGPIQGRIGAVRAATTGTSPNQALFQTAAQRMLNIMLEAKSGKQVTDQEYARLYRELANVNKPDVNFEQSLASSDAYIDNLLEREAAGVNLPGPATRPAGAASPFPETSTQPEEYVRDPVTGKLRKK